MFMTLTEQGKDLLAQLQATLEGELIFTRAELGDGYYHIKPCEPLKITRLVNKIANVDVFSEENFGAILLMKFRLSSYQTLKDFWRRESGLYAYVRSPHHETSPEVLFAYRTFLRRESYFFSAGDTYSRLWYEFVPMTENLRASDWIKLRKAMMI